MRSRSATSRPSSPRPVRDDLATLRWRAGDRHRIEEVAVAVCCGGRFCCGSSQPCYSVKSVGGETVKAVLPVLSMILAFVLSFAICCLVVAVRNLWRQRGEKRPLSKALFPSIPLTLPLWIFLFLAMDGDIAWNTDATWESSFDVRPSTAAGMTRGYMLRTLFRIKDYTKQHRALPQSLDVIPKKEGRWDRITDGWGRRLLYKTNGDGTITLASLGADGRPGGEGEDADLVFTCRVYRPDGSLWIGAPDWDDERNSCTRDLFSPKEYPRTYRKK